MKLGLDVPDDFVEILAGIRDELSAIRRLMESSDSPVAARRERSQSSPFEPAARQEPVARPESAARPVSDVRDEPAEAPMDYREFSGRSMDRSDAGDSMSRTAPDAPVRDVEEERETMRERPEDDTSHDDALMKLLGSMETPGDEPAFSDRPAPSHEEESKFDLSMDELEKIFGLDEGKK
ncbi:MAG: hypothetical protein AAB229_05745 [Candidatus Hydrogenedentota bacterium]